jgi:drug/metabolite transporter (DMT)-like permease
MINVTQTPANALAGPRARAWAALLVVWVFWGGTYVAIRIADAQIPPLLLAAVRYLLAGAALYAAVVGANRRRVRRDGSGSGLNADRSGPITSQLDAPSSGRPGSPSLRQWAGMAIVGTMLLAFGNGGVCYAEQTLPAGLAALLVASVPLWMALADRVINKRRIGALGWAALVVGLAGIGVLARPSGHGDAVAILIVLAASVSWALGSVLSGRLPAPGNPLLGSAMEMLAGGTVLVVLAAADGELTRFDPGHVGASSVLALLYLIGPGSLLALTCYVIALRGLPTAQVSTYAYVNPVVAVSLGALFLGERLTLQVVAGGAIVVVAVALLLGNRAGDQGRASDQGRG